MNEDKTSRPALVDEKVAARYIGMSVQFLRKKPLRRQPRRTDTGS